MADLIQPGGVWRQMQGMRFGLQERSVAGSVKVEALAAKGLPLLEKTLGDFVGEPLPPAGDGQLPNERLITLFAFAYVALLRDAHIATSSAFHFQAPPGKPGGAVTFEICIPSPSIDAGPIGLRWLRVLFNTLLRPGDGRHLEELRARREDVLDQLRPFASTGVNAFCILQAAYRLRIPVSQFDRHVLQLGTGRHARWMNSSITDASSAISVRLARMKHETARVLLAAGLPGGIHEFAGSAADAVRAAERLGYPVVVKPADQDKGAGVSADLRNAEAVGASWEAARKVSDKVLVEKWAPGHTHRLTVYNGHVIRVSRRIAGGVTGDGTSNISQLVALAQQTEAQLRAQRRAGERRLVLDEEALGLLEQEGLDASHVPAAGTCIRLRRRDNMNAGGTTESVPLDQVHPDNMQLARDATRLLRLDFAGVDLITRDITASWMEAGALICEVNAQPQMAARAEPDLWDRVVSELVGPCSRVPARLVIVPDDAEREQAIAGRIAREEPATSVSGRAGLWIGGRVSTLPFAGGFKAAQALLQRTDVESAACLMTLAELERNGLPLDLWDSIEVAEQPKPGSPQAQSMRLVMAMARAHVRVNEAERVS